MKKHSDVIYTPTDASCYGEQKENLVNFEGVDEAKLAKLYIRVK